MVRKKKGCAKMVKIFQLFLSCLIAFVISTGSYADDNSDHRELLSKHYQLQKPDGRGPFPAVILVPGCSGFNANFAKAHYDDVQSQLLEMGFVTLRVDYLAVRDVPICWPSVTTEDIANDISIAAEYLRQQPFVKKGSINVMGWSYGGAGALQALTRTEGRDPVDVNAVVAYYPACEHTKKWDSEITVPVLVLVGKIDDTAPFWQCEETFGDMTKRHNLTAREYENAHHCFDISALPAEKPYKFGTIGYNKAAAKSAWKEVTKFLKK